MSNKTIWKEKIKGYDIAAVQTSYGAIIMVANNTVFNGVHNSASWMGGIEDLSHAKEICLAYIEKDIVFGQKMEKAQKAYDTIMMET